MSEEPRTLRLTLTNRSARALTVALEPRGNVGELPRGASAVAALRMWDGEPHLEILVEDDSLTLSEEAGDTMLDVGSGAGLPGIPLAVVRPQTQVTLLDAREKKTAFLRQAVIELGLRNAEVVCGRIERYFPSARLRRSTPASAASAAESGVPAARMRRAAIWSPARLTVSTTASRPPAKPKVVKARSPGRVTQ